MAWISVVYLGVFSTVVAYILYFYLIRTIGSVRQTMVGYLLPVFGVFEGALFLREWDGVAWWFIFCEVIGTVMICAGIALVSFSLPKAVTRPFKNIWLRIRGLPPIVDEQSSVDLEKQRLVPKQKATGDSDGR